MGYVVYSRCLTPEPIERRGKVPAGQITLSKDVVSEIKSEVESIKNKNITPERLSASKSDVDRFQEILGVDFKDDMDAVITSIQNILNSFLLEFDKADKELISSQRMAMPKKSRKRPKQRKTQNDLRIDRINAIGKIKEILGLVYRFGFSVEISTSGCEVRK